MLGRQARLPQGMQTANLQKSEVLGASAGEIRTSSERPLWRGFVRSAKQFPGRPAVLVDGKQLTYGELLESARRIAATVQRHRGSSGLSGVLAYRSATAFMGVLGSLLAGKGYVPLNRTFPAERTVAMFERAECDSIVVDLGSLPQMEKLLDRAQKRVLAVLPEVEDVGSYRERWPNHSFSGSGDLAPAREWQEPEAQPNGIAYLLFTSGSTGVPKGVMVSHRNVATFLDYMVERYAITEEDRLSQMFDMTFDLSVFDMFVAWERGACVCCPSQKTLIKPGKFIQDAELTLWFSVPSVAVFMKQLGMLKAGQYPRLRWSLFCGEPLPVSSASAWMEAAPNSILENLYGPTELTIACTLYRWNASRSVDEAEMGIVPIGYPYPGMDVMVADESLNEVSPGKEGELLMNGPQMSLGYWEDAEKTAAVFVRPPGKTGVYYRTGDRVRRPVGDQPLTHLGRIDFQVKVQGHRVELGEIEAVVRKISGFDGVVAVGWPVTSSGYGGIEVFVEGVANGKDGLRTAVANELPDYMVPKRFHFMNRLPRNVNDKFDRKAMLNMLQEGI
jgi:amino acid adenylation domain-containing protein